MIDLQNLAGSRERRHPLSAGRFVAKLTMPLTDPPLSTLLRCTLIRHSALARMCIQPSDLGKLNHTGTTSVWTSFEFELRMNFSKT